MKFTNLVVKLDACDVGEYVRLSNSEQIVKIISKGMFITCRPIGSTGTTEIEPKRNVHRQID